MEVFERQKREKEFYEEFYSKSTMDYSAEYKLIEKVSYGMNLLGNAEGRTILDLCSGKGVTTYHLAKRNWNIISVDISYNAMKVLREFISSKGLLAKVSHVVSAAEILPFKDNTFDCIFCNGGLHHTEIPLAAKEVSRVLKTGGMGIFIETSAFNPVLMLARSLFPGKFGIPRRRTSDEHPITREDLMVLKNYFAEVKIVRSFHFLSMAGGYLVKSNSMIDRILLFIDKVILKLPLTKKFGYWIIIEVKK